MVKEWRVFGLPGTAGLSDFRRLSGPSLLLSFLSFTSGKIFAESLSSLLLNKSIVAFLRNRGEEAMGIAHEALRKSQARLQVGRVVGTRCLTAMQQADGFLVDNELRAVRSDASLDTKGIRLYAVYAGEPPSALAWRLTSLTSEAVSCFFNAATMGLLHQERLKEEAKNPLISLHHGVQGSKSKEQHQHQPQPSEVFSFYQKLLNAAHEIARKHLPAHYALTLLIASSKVPDTFSLIPLIRHLLFQVVSSIPEPSSSQAYRSLDAADKKRIRTRHSSLKAREAAWKINQIYASSVRPQRTDMRDNHVRAASAPGVPRPRQISTPFKQLEESGLEEVLPRRQSGYSVQLRSHLHSIEQKLSTTFPRRSKDDRADLSASSNNLYASSSKREDAMFVPFEAFGDEPVRGRGRGSAGAGSGGEKWRSLTREDLEDPGKEEDYLDRWLDILSYSNQEEGNVQGTRQETKKLWLDPLSEEQDEKSDRVRGGGARGKKEKVRRRSQANRLQSGDEFLMASNRREIHNHVVGAAQSRWEALGEEEKMSGKEMAGRSGTKALGPRKSTIRVSQSIFDVVDDAPENSRRSETSHHWSNGRVKNEEVNYSHVIDNVDNRHSAHRDFGQTSPEKSKVQIVKESKEQANERQEDKLPSVNDHSSKSRSTKRLEKINECKETEADRSSNHFADTQTSNH
eukprot:762774-Hanusia_phi.AAC.5